MAVTNGQLEARINSTIVNAGASHPVNSIFKADLKNSSDAFIYDRVLEINDYSLTVAAGALDIDLYDLGTLDVGAGAGRDNLGLDHANARVLAIMIRHQEDGNGGALRIDQSGAGASAWTGLFPSSTQLDLDEGAFVFAYLGESGKTVTDTTDNFLRLVAQTATCVFDLVVFTKQT